MKQEKTGFLVDSFHYNKEWYKSKTIWASLFVFVVAVTSAMFGESSIIVSTLISIGSMLGIYGRVTATTGIKK